TAALALAFSPDGKTLAAAGSTPAVRLWDVTTGEQLHRFLEAHTGLVCSVAFSADSRTLVTAAQRGDEEDTLRLWDAGSGKPLRKLKLLAGTDAVVFAPDGMTLASKRDGTVCLWDRATGQQLHQLKAPGGPTLDDLFLPLAFSWDSKLLATRTG